MSLQPWPQLGSLDLKYAGFYWDMSIGPYHDINRPAMELDLTIAHLDLPFQPHGLLNPALPVGVSLYHYSGICDEIPGAYAS